MTPEGQELGEALEESPAVLAPNMLLLQGGQEYVAHNYKLQSAPR